MSFSFDQDGRKHCESNLSNLREQRISQLLKGTLTKHLGDNKHSFNDWPQAKTASIVSLRLLMFIEVEPHPPHSGKQNSQYNNTIQLYFTMLATHNKSWFPGGA